jgi:hypothetical protein
MTQTLEDIRDNIVKIVDKNKKFHGTGFSIAPKYVVTCHHCLAKIASEIFVEKDGNLYHAEWNYEHYCIEKDIAFLRITDPIPIRILDHAKETYKEIPIYIWGYSGSEIDRYLDGTPAKTESIGVSFRIAWDGKLVTGNNKWNVWPPMKVRVFRVEGKYDNGFSGAPVCYTKDCSIVGIFNAKDENFGYIIPIEIVLDAFDLLKRRDKTNYKGISIFISKPSALNRRQKEILSRLKTMLKRRGIAIKELNRKDYPPETKPIAMIKDTISNCDGVIVLGFKQIRIIKGREKGGTKDPRTLINTFLPTAWNHIEATIGYMLDVPVLVIQEGVSGVYSMLVPMIFLYIRSLSLVETHFGQENLILY